MGTQHLEVRRAVRETLADLPADATVLVACSGGPDSLSLAAATAFEAHRSGRRAGSVTVDHGIQPGSAQRARAVGTALAGLGFDPVESIHLTPDQGGKGPEGDARKARYRALDAAAARHDAAAVLLGHTLDDQAETVLLGLARGSGARSLSGMAIRSGRYRRPLLRLTREVVHGAIPAELTPWADPHNIDPAYARSRVRHTVLPVLEAELGPGIAHALARTAELLRADADALDTLSANSYWRDVAKINATITPTEEPPDQRDLSIEELTQLPRAVRWRVLRRAAISAGCPATDLTSGHIEAIDALAVRWRGQTGIDLPGAIRARRTQGELRFEPLR